MTSNAPFQQFLTRMAELADINGAAALLSWDQETYMPKGAQEARGTQMSTLSAIAHQKFTQPEMGALLADLQGSAAPEDADQRLMVERVAWDFARATRVPESLVRETAKAQSDSVAAWCEARPANDFGKFLPYLERLLDLERQHADCLKAPGQSRYDALFEGYERGGTAESVEAVFRQLRAAIVPLLQRINDSPRPVSTACLEQRFDPEKQWDFGVSILKAMGFDFNTGRQDRSAHPFTSGTHATDVRITTRIFEENLTSGIFSSIHEGGHALYEQGIAPEDWRTPLGSSISLGIHESQSRLWENLVGRGLPFWTHFYPLLRESFSKQLGQVSLTEFHRAINAVRPSLIRVEADEVTYSLHIILRFEIERALLEGDLAPKDLPGAWREKMREYLGIEPPDDRDGCLQDIHWAWGMFGYFPTYTLGNLYAAQFFEQALKDIPGLESHISKGELGVLREWLREKVHKVGHRRLANELARDITGQPLNAAPFIHYLEKKYSEIYGV